MLSRPEHREELAWLVPPGMTGFSGFNNKKRRWRQATWDLLFLQEKMDKTFHLGGERVQREKMLLNTTMWMAFRLHANLIHRVYKGNVIYYLEDITYFSLKS